VSDSRFQVGYGKPANINGGAPYAGQIYDLIALLRFAAFGNSRSSVARLRQIQQKRLNIPESIKPTSLFDGGRAHPIGVSTSAAASDSLKMRLMLPKKSILGTRSSFCFENLGLSSRNFRAGAAAALWRQI